MNATDYVLLLAIGVRYRVRFESDKGKVLDFVIKDIRTNWEAWIAEYEVRQ